MIGIIIVSCSSVVVKRKLARYIPFSVLISPHSQIQSNVEKVGGGHVFPKQQHKILNWDKTSRPQGECCLCRPILNQFEHKFCPSLCFPIWLSCAELHLK